MHNICCMAGKTVLVTGASSGIGRAVAILLSKFSAKVVLVSSSVDNLKKTEKMLEGEGHIIYPIDFNKPRILTEDFKKICNEVGPLDGMVHSAGIQLTTPLQFVSLEEVNKMFNVNLLAAIFLSQAFRQKGVAQPHSSVVFLSSVIGITGEPGLSVYSATKGGIISLTKSLSVELSRQNIRVNCIAPGLIDTPMVQSLYGNKTCLEKWKLAHSLGFGKPIDIANMVAFLLSNAGSWITGSCFVIDGGFSSFKIGGG